VEGSGKLPKGKGVAELDLTEQQLADMEAVWEKIAAQGGFKASDSGYALYLE
jgi:hypothetical protein